MAVLVLVGPSAVGKTYMADLLQTRHGNIFEQAKLITTRPPRANDAATDRISVDDQAFDTMIESGAFAAYGAFHAYRYGYPKEIFEPGQKHLVINVWPPFLPNLLALPNTIPVALTAKPSFLPVLKKRMHQRGDSDQAISERTELIRTDIALVDSLADKIRSQGALFTITSDSDVTDTVLPWILERFTAKA